MNKLEKFDWGWTPMITTKKVSAEAATAVTGYVSAGCLQALAVTNKLENGQWYLETRQSKYFEYQVTISSEHLSLDFGGMGSHMIKAGARRVT